MSSFLRNCQTDFQSGCTSLQHHQQWKSSLSMNHIFLIHSTFEGYLGSFQHLAIINKTAMNMAEYVFLLHVGVPFGYMPRSGIAGSSGCTMSNFSRNCQTDFQSGCTSWQSHKQWKTVPLSPHPLQHLLSSEFLILAILSGMRCNLRIVLISIFLMTRTFL